MMLLCWGPEKGARISPRRGSVLARRERAAAPLAHDVGLQRDQSRVICCERRALERIADGPVHSLSERGQLAELRRPVRVCVLGVHCHSPRGSRRAMLLYRDRFPGRPVLDTAVSHAMLRRVARADAPLELELVPRNLRAAPQSPPLRSRHPV